MTILLPWTLAAPTLGGITVTSYTTLASTNGYAPSLQGPYFAEQRLENVSPALAQVSGDWIGPNADGTPATWHWVGTALSSSTTTFDINSYVVTASGSFEYELNTTADFVDPQPSVLSPGAVGNYNGLFNTDVSTTYTISAELSQRGRVRLNSLSGAVVFDQSNHTPTPILINLNGIIPPGQYRVLFSTSYGPPNLPNGVNHDAATGSYENLVFTVQIPEPNTGMILVFVIGEKSRRRARFRCAV